MTDLIAKLAAKAHAHQLVPFVGAGCSLGHVQVDWDGITELMADRVTPRPVGTNAEISEAFVQAHGHHALADVLANHLLIKEFLDQNGTIPLQILAFELRALYTTNQDNVLEAAATKYGRPIVIVSTLEELCNVRPGDRVLYKFHGALDHPETLVFTESQYAARMAGADNFLDIRLRSDLLTKSLFFIGYSFRDRNIKALLSELRERFPQALPGSYLVAYRWSEELDQLCTSYGVKCVDPAVHVRQPSTDLGANLEAFLRELRRDVQTQRGRRAR